jgi:hypothetical protein
LLVGRTSRQESGAIGVAVKLPVRAFIRPYAEFRIMPRKFTAAADGRCRERYDLGLIRRTELDVSVSDCDLQLDRPAVALLRTPQMSARFGLATLETAETLGASRSAFLPNYVEQAKPLRAVLVASKRLARVLLGIIRNSA